jgi:hypothetical protein
MTTPLKEMAHAGSRRSSPVQQEVAIMKSKNTKRWIDPLMLLAVLVTLGVMMTATVSADESFISNPNINDLQDGDVTLAKSEHGGAGIHMSIMSPSALNVNSDSSYVLTSVNGSMPDVYLSLRLPW